ncbi:ATP-binding protein [Flavobacterium sp. SM15]|uniref:tetratricopeptide repeat-containing sensor histidine kinase n=1 Tax=Flavobacterium sp. SM15 TaxID=2908005 RepID=UPI001EDAD706|nr:ATP-binding protein [Flavobacterium sp. SM15]
MRDSVSYYVEKKKIVKALQYCNKKIDYSSKMRDIANYTNYICKKARIYNYQLNEHEKALKLLYDAKAVLDKKGSNQNKSLLANEISNTYRHFGLYSEAISVSKKALKNYVKENDTVKGYLLEEILESYHRLGNKDSVYRYLEPNLKESKKLNNYHKISDAFNLYYGFHFSIKEYDIGKKYLDTALVYAEKSKSIRMITTTKGNLALFYLLNEKDYRKAIKIHEELIKGFEDTPINEEIATYHLNLNYAFEQIGNYKKANEHLNVYLQYVEDNFNSRINEEVKNIKAKYEVDKIEEEYDQKEAQLKVKQRKSEKLMYILLSLLLFAGVLFYFFYQNLKLKQKNKLKDVTQKVQQNLINATIDGQEEERKRLSGVLHDNISALLSSAGLHISAFEATYPDMKDELKKTKNILKEAHDKVRDLSHDLIPPVLEKLGLVAAFEDLCEKNSNTLIQFNFNNFIKEEVRFQSEFEMKLYFIVAELFNNIIKHSNASEASLTIDKNQRQLSINIEDNGIGFKNKDGKHADGFGLSQIKARIKNMNGSIVINSKENAGTLIYIKVEIPDAKSNSGSQFHNV